MGDSDISPYETTFHVMKYQYNKDFINRDEIINKLFWKTKIEKLLNSHSSGFYKQGVHIYLQQYDEQMNYCFYLDGVKGDIPQLSKEVSDYLGNSCYLVHRYGLFMDSYKQIKTLKFATWIVISRDAQLKYDSSKLNLFRRFCMRFTKKDFYILIICIFGFIITLYLLLDHWSGYKNPCLNIIEMLKILLK